MSIPTMGFFIMITCWGIVAYFIYLIDELDKEGGVTKIATGVFISLCGPILLHIVGIPLTIGGLIGLLMMFFGG